MGLFSFLFGKNAEVSDEQWQELKQSKEWKQQEAEDKSFSKLLNRNIKGTKHEKEGRIDLAIKLYEKNISENFEGKHPYDRLAIIYRKQKDLENEIRVLNKAIEVFSNLLKSSPRQDIKPKLEKFKSRLEKAKSLKKPLN